MAQHHNPKIVTNGLIYHLDPTNGGKRGSKIITKPTQVDDCTLWLDADDAESVVLSSSNVTNWLDKSGSGNHCSQSTTSKQPVKNGTLNSRSTLTFDGTQYLDNTSMVASSTNMLFIVKKINNVADGFSLFSFVATSNVIGLYYWGLSTDQYGFNSWNGDSWGINNFDKEGLFQIDAALFKDGSPASSGVELYINGETQSLSQVNGTSVSRAMSTGYRVGRGDSTTDQEFNGEMAEVIVYARDLSDAERQSVEYYLSRKWAIPLKGRVTTNLADGVSTTIINSSPVEVTHNNTFYFPHPSDDSCDLRLEANEISVADNLPWTIEFWIKRHARGPMGPTGIYAGVWGNSYSSSNYERMQFGPNDDDVLAIQAADSSGGPITNIVDLDCLHKWRHVVLAFDGTTAAATAGSLRQYVDGSDKGPAIALDNADSGITVKRIGSRGHLTDAHRLEGELGNFRVYDKQLSHAEVLQNYNAQRAKYQNKKMSFAAPDNLLLYLDAQSATSANYYADGTWFDISGGTLYNATRANATFTQAGVKYYDFDGTGDYFTTTVDWSANGNRTFACWLKLDDISASRMIFDTSNQGDFSVQTDGQVRSHPVASNWNDTTNSLVINVWYYIVLTQSSTARKIYINAVEESLTVGGGSPQTVAWNNPTSDMRLGHAGSYRSDLNGQMANVMVYDIELSADQIVQNYNYFKHRFGK